MNSWQALLKHCMGGGCNVTPAEKLKASQATLSPFVVGENENISTSNGVWIYGDNQKVENKKEKINHIIINGNTINSNKITSTIICNNHSTLTPATTPPNNTDNYFSGVTIQSEHSNIFSIDSDGTTTSQTVDFRFSGVHIMGSYAKIEGPTSWNEVNTISHPTKTEEVEKLIHAPFCYGVSIVGSDSSCIFRPRSQDGTHIYGANGVINSLNNSGVIIGGTTRSCSISDQTHKTEVFGAGIFIRGILQNINESGSVKSYSPSLIQVSTLSSKPTTLKGYLQLDNDFQLKDSSGTILIDSGKLKQIINTVNELKEEVETLKNQANS